MDAVAVRRGHSVSIDIRRVTTPYGFSYADGGWHPYWVTLVEYLDGTNQQPETSQLAEFFARYQPRSASEALFPSGTRKITPLLRLDPRDVTVTWTINTRQFRSLADPNCPGRHTREVRLANHNIGPATASFLRSEFTRLVGILESLQRHGYRPREFLHGVIEGYFLISGDDYRFIPTEGQHRLGALRALGIDKIEVIPRFGLSSLDRRHLHRWTHRYGRPYTLDEARLLFDRFFEVRSRPWGGEHTERRHGANGAESQ